MKKIPTFTGPTLILGPCASGIIRAPDGGRWALQSLEVSGLIFTLDVIPRMKRALAGLITVSDPVQTGLTSGVVSLYNLPTPTLKVSHSQRFPSGGILIENPHDVLIAEVGASGYSFELFFPRKNQLTGEEWFAGIVGRHR
jgi:hypothetical protein